jgi:hypothetical protein
LRRSEGRPSVEGGNVASIPKEQSEPERLREVIRLLNLALDDCHRLLDQAENDVRIAQQDNDPPHKS